MNISVIFRPINVIERKAAVVGRSERYGERILAIAGTVRFFTACSCVFVGASDQRDGKGKRENDGNKKFYEF